MTQKADALVAPKGRKWRRDTVVAFFVCWAVVGLVQWQMVNRGYGPWIELFSGATWPSQWLPSKEIPNPGYDFLFHVVLSLRTLLNLGVLLTAVTVAYWLFTFRLTGALMDKLGSVFRTQNVLLAHKLVQMLEDRQILIPPKVEAELVEAARSFGAGEFDKFLRGRIEDAASAAV